MQQQEACCSDKIEQLMQSIWHTCLVMTFGVVMFRLASTNLAVAVALASLADISTRGMWMGGLYVPLKDNYILIKVRLINMDKQRTYHDWSARFWTPICYM